jgi:hypothetical protein
MITRQRRECLIQYGGRCHCPDCGETRLECLEIDHRHGQGNAHRRQLAPERIEAVLEAAGYPEHLDGHIIQLLCQRCHQSKTQHGACAIDHAEDVMDEDDQQNQPDMSPHARNGQKGVSGGRGRMHALVNLSTRVDEATKAALEKRTNGGKSSLGQVIKDLLAHVEGGSGQRYDAIMGRLAQLEEQVSSLALLVRTLQPPRTTEPETTPQGIPPDRFAHLQIVEQPPPTSAPSEPPIAQRSWWSWWSLWRH